jgi:hypothetical protein
MGGPWGIEPTGAKEPGNIGETLSPMLDTHSPVWGIQKMDGGHFFSQCAPKNVEERDVRKRGDLWTL